MSEGKQFCRFGCACTPASGRVEAPSARRVLARLKSGPTRTWVPMGTVAVLGKAVALMRDAHISKSRYGAPGRFQEISSSDGGYSPRPFPRRSCETMIHRLGLGDFNVDDGARNQRWRVVVFGVGCIAAMIAIASTLCSWTAPFPLVSDGRGDLSLNPLEGKVLVIGLWAAFATSLLGAFGKGKSRVALVSLGPMLAVISLFGWLGNHR